MSNFRNYSLPYSVDSRFSKKVAYFSMEFAVHQPLKIYSGGLGFLSGSHLRSAYELRQHLIGVGILWKYGYYDQARNQDQTLQVQWNEKIYNFLEDTGIKFQIMIHDAPVWVKALRMIMYLKQLHIVCMMQMLQQKLHSLFYWEWVVRN
jgi:starch phosphorylase